MLFVADSACGAVFCVELVWQSCAVSINEGAAEHNLACDRKKKENYESTIKF